MQEQIANTWSLGRTGSTPCTAGPQKQDKVLVGRVKVPIPAAAVPSLPSQAALIQTSLPQL